MRSRSRISGVNTRNPDEYLPVSVVWQKTLKTAISCTGIGLHGGKRIEMTLLPAAPGTGIRFRRQDLDGEAIEARHDNVSDT
ncbi:MAG: UDP-3-O-acyl-N-acetylglucosamine deacetylase, partial [Proteobacteria bacterium]|nr:UDP-3-O-acyl-N-acetylglucosamine deacetylase [Pseudomonadota bacterium]